MSWHKIEKIEHNDLQFVLDFSDSEDEKSLPQTKILNTLPLNLKVELLLCYDLKFNKNKKLCNNSLHINNSICNCNYINHQYFKK